MIIISKTCQDFTLEHRDEAARLVVNSGRTVATAARQLGINEAMLTRR